MPGATRRVLCSVPEVWGWGSATAQLDGALLASEVVTSVVEHAVAEHTLSVADGAAARRIVGDVRQPVPEAVPACASSRPWPNGGRRDSHGGRRVWFGLDDHIDHIDHTDHHRVADRVGAS
jgi:hypothetical protein